MSTRIPFRFRPEIVGVDTYPFDVAAVLHLPLAIDRVAVGRSVFSNPSEVDDSEPAEVSVVPGGEAWLDEQITACESLVDRLRQGDLPGAAQASLRVSSDAFAVSAFMNFYIAR